MKNVWITMLAVIVIASFGRCQKEKEDNPPSVSLAKGQVFGFKNVASGKQGLLYIRTDQGTAWPSYVVDQNTKVGLLREH